VIFYLGHLALAMYPWLLITLYALFVLILAAVTAGVAYQSITRRERRQ
jgi:hypothetical protein